MKKCRRSQFLVGYRWWKPGLGQDLWLVTDRVTSFISFCFLAIERENNISRSSSEDSFEYSGDVEDSLSLISINDEIAEASLELPFEEQEANAFGKRQECHQTDSQEGRRLEMVWVVNYSHLQVCKTKLHQNSLLFCCVLHVCSCVLLVSQLIF